MSKRIKTRYPGVYYRQARRIGGTGTENVYYVVFKKNGKVYEEKVGRQYIHAMTPARAARIRAERIEGRRLSRKEIKQASEAKKNAWTISRLWQEYKTCNPGLKGIITDESRFQNHIKPRFGDKEPQDILPLDVDRLRIHLLKVKEPGTVRNVLELLRRIINFGVKKQLIGRAGFMIAMPKVNNKKTEDLTSEELANLIKAMNEDPNIEAADLMRMVLFTGMRRGELFRLQKPDIDFERGFIHIRNPKGGQDQKIPLNDAARQLLENRLKTDSPYVFPGRNGKQRIDFRKPLNRIKKGAGLPKDFRPLHGLRHVYASMLASSGKVDMYVLQKLLTHKSPSMTQRYAHLRDEALRRASDLAGSLIDEAMNGKKRGAI